MCCYFLPPIPIAAAEPLKERPRVTHLFLALNTTVWMALNLLTVAGHYGAVPPTTSESILKWLAFTPTVRSPWSYVTSAFTQESAFHLLSNLLFLWMFGSFLEERLGWKRYAMLLLVGGALGCAAHDQVLTLRGLDEIRNLPLVGASGMVFTILGAYIVLLPSLQFKCFYILGVLWHWTVDTIMIPAAIYIPLWVMLGEVIQFYTDKESTVAHAAHLGGFATGLVSALIIRYGPKREKTV